VHVSEPLVDYVQALLGTTRNSPELVRTEPACRLGLLAAARAWALLDGRDHVVPTTSRPCSRTWPRIACIWPAMADPPRRRHSSA
jgi:hypothetical protein